MTRKQLVEYLLLFPEDSKVYFWDSDFGPLEINEARLPTSHDLEYLGSKNANAVVLDK